MIDEIDPTYNFFRNKIESLNKLPEVVGLGQNIEISHSQKYIDKEPGVKKAEFAFKEYKNLKISGDLKNRLIISQPETPKIPVWFKEKVTGPVEVEVCVDAKGDVVFCRRLISSGSYTVDIIGLDYARNFTFTPHKQLFQYGRIKVLFDG